MPDRFLGSVGAKWCETVLYVEFDCQRVFPECLARVPVFTLGVWGVRVCSLDVALTFATVRNRSMAVSIVSSAEGVTFGGFACGVASFRVAGVALRDTQTFL